MGKMMMLKKSVDIITEMDWFFFCYPLEHCHPHHGKLGTKKQTENALGFRNVRLLADHCLSLCLMQCVILFIARCCRWLHDIDTHSHWVILKVVHMMINISLFFDSSMTCWHFTLSGVLKAKWTKWVLFFCSVRFPQSTILLCHIHFSCLFVALHWNSIPMTI